MKGFGLFLGKILAALALSAAYLSNFTSCIIYINQPRMPEKVRMLKNSI